MASMKLLEELLKATWNIVLSWLDAKCSGLTDYEVLRLRATVMKARVDQSWFDKDNPSIIFII